VKRLRRGLLGLCALSLLALWLLFTLGTGGRSEFCPATLECRGVSVYSVPYTDLVVWTHPSPPERRRIVQFWFDEGYARTVDAPERWHVIIAWAPWFRGGHGPAKVFWNWTGCGSDEVAEEWIAWSRRNPALAADLWPRVVGLLRQAGTDALPGERYNEAMLLMMYVKEVEGEPKYRERIAEWQQRCADARER
jgi:hypothetical protein